MNITVTFTITQTKALIHSIATNLHLADKSTNTAMAYGIDIRMVELLNAALERIEQAIPTPSPIQTNETCTLPPTTSMPSPASLQNDPKPTPAL